MKHTCDVGEADYLWRALEMATSAAVFQGNPKANLAQLVEQLICNQPVVGSSPTVGSITINGLWGFGENNPIGSNRFVTVFSGFSPCFNCVRSDGTWF